MAEDRSQSSQSVGGRPATPFQDLYHYLVRSPWPILLMLVLGAFTAANALFALAYWLDGGVQGSRPHSYPDMFFFSVQTMSTIGYGVLHPTTFFANALASLEALMGLVGLAVMTGLVFAKFSLPTARVRFSRYAVISRRDGVPSLMFRTANLRESHILEAQIHLVFSRVEVTAEGERLRRFYDLRLQRERSALFTLSWTVVHQILPDSPLTGQTPESLRDSGVMVVVSLTGLEQTFSQTVNARQFYGAEDILWGKRLADITVFRGDETPVLDYSRFDDVVDAPL
ncbi:MAG: ATP-sensitive inward rectifier potassium channel 10 [Deltaproteobacteria bacterium]|jgi:inward rectifier potassium channel|nr:ATP-sensitive inward rectifier potassium channel 10 [Deltaproteobacteria bacterium]